MKSIRSEENPLKIDDVGKNMEMSTNSVPFPKDALRLAGPSYGVANDDVLGRIEASSHCLTQKLGHTWQQ